MTFNENSEPVEEIEFGEYFEPDLVVIYTAPDGPREYRATPFIEDEVGYTELGPEFKANDEYTEAIRERTDVDGDIQFIRHWADPPEPL